MLRGAPLWRRDALLIRDRHKDRYP